ncbi:MAG: substrate-binding domain-containing protein [Phycisphaerae bacterium]|nr:substrate-binding domain-containing protein [Phycisphaerae bacterium]
MNADQLAGILRARLIHYLPGSRLPGIAELASQFSITSYQVRKALALLSGEGFIKPRRPSGHVVLAQSTHRPVIRTLHVLHGGGQMSESFRHAILVGVDQRSDYYHLPLRVHPIDNMRDVHPGDLARLAGDDDPKSVGWLIIEVTPAAAVLRDWLSRGERVVLLDTELPSLQVSTVCNDRCSVIYAAAELLLLHGHHRIAYLGGLDNVVNDARKRGFDLACRRHHAAVETGLVWDRSALADSEIVDFATACLSKPNRPTGVVAADQFLGWCVLAACDRLGIAVPEQFSVISGGFQRRELRDLPDRLSRMDEGPPELVGRMAVDLLMQMHALTHPVHLFTGYQWVDRGSTSAPRQDPAHSRPSQTTP